MVVFRAKDTVIIYSRPPRNQTYCVGDGQFYVEYGRLYACTVSFWGIFLVINGRLYALSVSFLGLITKKNYSKLQHSIPRSAKRPSI